MRALLAGAAVAAALVACTGASPSPSGSAVLSVVTSTTVFGDFVQQVGGSRVSVESLVPRGGDVHTFDPAPADARAVSQAKLIVLNGLGLDDWLLGVVRDAGAANTPVLKLAEQVPGAWYIHDNGSAANPHLWMNVAYARGYASLIATQLIQLDPAGKPTYDANLATYDGKLVELDNWVRSQFAPLTPDQRRVVSFHDAFPYFADTYGLDVVGVIVPAPGQDPSAGELAALVQAIKNSHVKAVLSEAQFDPRLAQTIADETGAKWVQNLYDDSLGDPPLDSFDAIMRWDTNQITQALR